MHKVKLEFYISPKGRVIVTDGNTHVTREYTEDERRLTEKLLGLIKVQYPCAYNALSSEYEKAKLNRIHYDYLRVHRFIRCNLGKFDGLKWDIEDNVLHLEDTVCPLKWGNDCKMKGIICNPTPFGLTPRETEVAKLSSFGRTYEEISEELGITHSTIKNTLQKIKEKLHLDSSKEITKLFISTL
ncbi:MAG: helix-turn-helix transcriptional regulator [Prevotella koreensis]|uniref:helix-turn-helix transcriptional regulator n=1 Tax=Prevotella koreensis TaxID=2490854 RepID=UPI003F9F62B4